MDNAPIIRHYSEVMDNRAEMLAELADVLFEVGSAHVLVGGLAVGYHGRQRATIDVDLLVPKSDLAPIAKALMARGYQVTRTQDMLRVYGRAADPTRDEAIPDLAAKEAHPVLAAAFAATERANILGHPVNVVQRGALVALKFHAASSLSRKHADRLQDVVDIERIISRRFDPEDFDLARRIVELAHPGAADELAKLVDDLRHERPITI